VARRLRFGWWVRASRHGTARRVARAGGGGGWSVACGPPRFLGVRAAGLVERRVGMAQAVVGKLAAVRHGRVDRRVVPQDGGEQ
jgi:hypothetical protein